MVKNVTTLIKKYDLPFVNVGVVVHDFEGDAMQIRLKTRVVGVQT